MNIVLLSKHWYPSPRRAGFHHLADAWHALGHKITFATVGFSWLSYILRDFRTRYPGIWSVRNRIQPVRAGFDSYVHFTPLHPHTTLIPALDMLLARRMSEYDRYPLGAMEKRIRDADIIVYESCAAICLFRYCRKLAPMARHIYRVSDDICALRSTPEFMKTLENEIASEFSLVSVPCRALAAKFPGLPSLRMYSHGINKDAFDACRSSPYAPATKNAVFCGLGFYDMQVVHAMAIQSPDVHIHVVGLDKPKGHIPSNVTYYGEMPFADTIPFIKYADCGLYTLRFSSRPMQAYTDSLKIIQYRYCGLPIIAPDFLDLRRDGVFYYTPGNAASCNLALKNALQSGRNPEYAKEVRSWSEVARALLDAS